MTALVGLARGVRRELSGGTMMWMVLFAMRIG